MLHEQYAELAELAGGFIHEIKNHLSTLGLNLQLLAEDFGEPQSQRERRAFDRVNRLQAECKRLVQVSNDFLRFAGVKDLALMPTNLAEVIEEMVDFFSPTAKAANIEIKAFVPSDLPPVPLDRDLFKQAMLNLMLNAEQAMPGGGELTIQAMEERGTSAERGARSAECGTEEKTEEKTDQCSALRAPSSALVLSLIDTGQGMTPEVRAKVFKPFFSTKPGGSGLGLPTVRKIIEAHHAQIDVQSEVGKGTKFTIRLSVGTQPSTDGNTVES
jgi:two-component system, NtrC family, sensor histidine kinase HydH